MLGMFGVGLLKMWISNGRVWWGARSCATPVKLHNRAQTCMTESGNSQVAKDRPRGMSKIVPVPRLPIESIRFVTTVMDGTEQRAQLGACTH
jgi:hypothetical protein